MNPKGNEEEVEGPVPPENSGQKPMHPPVKQSQPDTYGTLCFLASLRKLPFCPGESRKWGAEDSGSRWKEEANAGLAKGNSPDAGLTSKLYRNTLCIMYTRFRTGKVDLKAQVWVMEHGGKRSQTLPLIKMALPTVDSSKIHQ